MKLSRGLACFFFGIFAASTVHAFTLNRNNLGNGIDGWSGGNVTYDYNYASCPAGISTAELDAAVRAALSIWNGVPTAALTVNYGSSVTKTAAQAKAQTTASNPVIVCDTSFSATTGADGDFVPAAASIILLDSNNRISFAVLYLNAEVGKDANIENMSTTSLEVIMAHEIGHSLGLGHSSDTGALMYFDATLKTSLNLSKDDTDGITYLYPRNELGGSKIMGCTSASLDDITRSGGPFKRNVAIDLSLVAVALWIAYQRRTKIAL